MVLYWYIGPVTFIINPGGDVSIYRQIVRQVIDAVAAGRLRAGDPMPSQERVARLHTISPLTVKKAYDELEHMGVVEMRRGVGTFVCAQAREGRPALGAAQLRESVRHLAAQARVYGVSTRELVDMVREAAADLREERSEAAGRDA